MYRLQTTLRDSEPRSKTGPILAGFGIVIALSLVGFVGVMAVGYYLPAASAKSYWFISRSSGIIAYVLLTLGMVWGLIQSGNLFRKRIQPVLALGLHSYLNLLGLGLAALHGIILIGDRYIKIDLPRVFTPFISTYRPIPVGLGIVAFYLMLLLTLSFYARSHLGQNNFRMLHYMSFAVFIMVTVHSLFAGTDSPSLWWLYSLSLGLVVVLTVMRVASTRRNQKPKVVAQRSVSALASSERP